MIYTSLVPWLTVRNSAEAVAFYTSAFGAIEVYRIESPDGDAVVRLAVESAEFWVSDGDNDNINPESVGGGTVRMILTVPHPDELFERSLKAGATEIFPVSEEHGWRLGRLVDPFGLHWEIGHPLE